MGQFKFILWLAYWYLQAKSFEFEWDTGNSTKSIQKHGVTQDEVESVTISPPVDEERLCIVGPSSNGRMISVVFTLREGRVRPISSRIAGKKERRLYEEIRKTTQRIR